MKIEFESKLFDKIEVNKVLKNEPMKPHTTFRIGGPADYFVMPETVEDVKNILELCREYEMPWCVIGNGSNLLVSDQGIRGVVIQIYKAMNQLKVEGDRIYAQAGCTLGQIANAALDAELTGFEFAAGIPGTLGGAVRMNAGAYGGEMKDVLETVEVLLKEGELQTYKNEEMKFGYRTSLIEENGALVLGAVIQLKKGERSQIKEIMDDLRDKRVSKQPLEFPSAGSTFKRPEGFFAGKLIQDAGLKGYCVGDACVSEKHSGFVINKGNATAADVTKLMEDVQAEVQKQFGVHLEPEVRRMGEF